MSVHVFNTVGLQGIHYLKDLNTISFAKKGTHRRINFVYIVTSETAWFLSNLEFL